MAFIPSNGRIYSKILRKHEDDYSAFSFCYQILNFSGRKINVTINDYDISDVDDDDDNDVFL